MSFLSSCWFKFGVGPAMGIWFILALYTILEPLADNILEGKDRNGIPIEGWFTAENEGAPTRIKSFWEILWVPYLSAQVICEIKRQQGTIPATPLLHHVTNAILLIPRAVIALGGGIVAAVLGAVPVGVYFGTYYSGTGINLVLDKWNIDSIEKGDLENMGASAGIVSGLGAVAYGLSKLRGSGSPEQVEVVAEPEPVELQDQWRNAATNTYDELSGSTSGKAAMAGAALAGVGVAAAASYGAYKAIQGVRNRGKKSGDSTDSKSDNKSSKKSRSGKNKNKKESSSSWMIYAVIGGVVLILLYLIFTSGDKSDRVQVMQPDIENGLLRQD